MKNSPAATDGAEESPEATKEQPSKSSPESETSSLPKSDSPQAELPLATTPPQKSLRRRLERGPDYSATKDPASSNTFEHPNEAGASVVLPQVEDEQLAFA